MLQKCFKQFKLEDIEFIVNKFKEEYDVPIYYEGSRKGIHIGTEYKSKKQKEFLVLREDDQNQSIVFAAFSTLNKKDAE